VAHEVESGEYCLVLRPAEPAAKLLEEHRRRLGGTQEEDGVHVRQVDAFIEQVHREEDLQGAGLQSSQGSATLVLGGLAGDGLRGNPPLPEGGGHPVGMLDAHTEAEGAHRVDVGDLVLELPQDDPEPRIVGGVDRVQLGEIVSAPLPLDSTEVRVVGDPEVVERTQQFGLERVPQPQLDRCPVPEHRPDIEAVATFRGRGETQQLPRTNLREESPVAGGLRVVELVDDDDVEGGCGQLVDEVTVERLDGREHLLPPARALPSHQEFTEVGISEHLAVGPERLLQDLAPVRHEQEARPRWAAPGISEVAVVERRHHGLARTRGSHDQVAVTSVDLPLHLEGLEHLLLERVRTDVQPGQ